MSDFTYPLTHPKVSFFQPDPQAYPLSDGKTFPNTHGQTASFFQDSGVQQEFAFIPDDGSATYVINVETNTTQSLAGPTTKDAKATYAAGITSLVQLDSTGALSFLPYKQADASTNSNAAWSNIANVAAVAPPGSTAAATPSASGSSASAKASARGSATGSAVGSSQSPNLGGAQATNAGSKSLSVPGINLGGVALAGVLGLVACLL